MKLIKCVVILLPLVLMVGCKEEIKTTEYYVQHHDELIQKYTWCLLNHQFQGNEECQHARDAARLERNAPDIKAGLKKAGAMLTEQIKREHNNE